MKSLDGLTFIERYKGCDIYHRAESGLLAPRYPILFPDELSPDAFILPSSVEEARELIDSCVDEKDVNE